MPVVLKRIILITSFIIAPSFAATAAQADLLNWFSAPQMRFVSLKVVGKELRLVLETSRRYQGPADHSSTTSDVKSYFILIDLASQKPLPEHARVYGPLWETPNPRSGIIYDAGAIYSKEDAEAARATPWYFFSAEGTLLRFRWDKAQNATVRESFIANPREASWKHEGDVRPINPGLPTRSHLQLFIKSGEWMLAFNPDAIEHPDNEHVTLYNLFTCEPKPDPWLTGCFMLAHSMDGLNFDSQCVTQDLDYFVLRTLPRFELDGKVYLNQEYAVAFGRPVLKPFVFAIKNDPEHLPLNPFSIGGKLFLFNAGKRSLSLDSSDGTKEFHVSPNPNDPWPILGFRYKDHAPESHELLLFADFLAYGDGTNGHSLVCVWNYMTNKIILDELHLATLFEVRDAQFWPKAALTAKP